MSDLSKIIQDDSWARAIIEAMPCGLLIIDGQGSVLAVNSIVEHVFGVEQHDIAGKGFGDALCCIYTLDESAACCVSDPCKHCEIRELALKAIYQNRKRRARTTLQTIIKGQVQELILLLCTVPFRFQNKRLGLLLIEDISNLRTLAQPDTENGFRGIIGQDARMLELFETIRQIGPTDAPVLIQGESGTGKELVALAIHKESLRSHKRFVPVNCGALPEGLLESELFGHVKGAFTGAIQNKKGRFDLADGGTIFLDEVAELNPAMQTKFLRVLENGCFERVGGEQTIQVNVRVISATNSNIDKEMERHKFRRDLYFRLCVMPIAIPSLPERREDIPLLADYFLKNLCEESYRPQVSLSPTALSILKGHDWPGNIRELINVLRFALIKCRGNKNKIEPAHFPPTLFAQKSRFAAVRHRKPKLQTADVFEALKKAGGNKRQAAEILGVSRSTLYRFFEREEARSS